jgi:hypothetical protein
MTKRGAWGACAVLVAWLLANAVNAQPAAGVPYQLRNGTRCVASSAAMADLALATCDADASAQVFYLEARDGGTFGVQSDASGAFFDVTGASTEVGAVLVAWPGNGNDNPRFAFKARGADAYELRPAHATDRCVAAQPDDSVQLAACDAGATAQAWELVPVEVTPLDTPWDCDSDELFEPRFVENGDGGPTGLNVVIMTRGYMLALYAHDSGGPPGILHFYDVANPRRAVRQTRIDDEHTQRFREAHSLPVALINGEEFVAIQTIDGIQFWDLSTPGDASFVSQIDLPGVEGGDYENVAWQADWQGRYLYVAGANQGIYVIDAADPTNAQLVTQVPTGQTGGFRIGPLFARGSYLVVGNMDQNGAISVLDIARPDQPALLGTIDGLPRLYTILATGDRIYGAGRDGDLTIHSFEDPTTIEEVHVERIEQDSLYVAAQDHFVFSGRQNNFVKVDISDEMNPEIVGEGTLGRATPDHGQVTPLGNWLFVGNDHGTGSAFFCHAETDDLPLAVQTIFPADGSTHQDPLTHITLVFSDYVDTTTVSPETIAIRPSGGEPLDGIYTYNFNTLSFSPSAPFAENTTFEIALQADGVKDVSGNPLGAELIARFSTGDMVVIAPPPLDEPDAGAVTGGAGGSTGGAGGMVASGGSGGTSEPEPPAMMDGEMMPSAETGGAGGAESVPSSEASDCACRIGVRASTAHGRGAALLFGAALWLVHARARRRRTRV